MAEITAQEMRQLEMAQAELGSMDVGGPPVMADTATSETAGPVFAAAGSGTAQHILVDHYFTGSLRRLWVFAGGQWRYVDIRNTEEQGMAQVAYASDRVDASWDGSNKLTMVLCLKSF